MSQAMLVHVLVRLKRWATLPTFFNYWALLALFLDSCLTFGIVWKVPFTNVDWEAYAAQVDSVLAGEFDYRNLHGPTGPIAYPAGFCWLFGFLRWTGIPLLGLQLLFAALYLATLAVYIDIYRLAGAPGYLLVLCLLSKRVHSIFVLRLFNDAVAQLFAALALQLFLRRRQAWAALCHSFSISIKMQAVLHSPMFGLCIVLSSGWRAAIPLVLLMLFEQLALAFPFLFANARSYILRAFGGPGDLQHVWSVNWRFLPEVVFEHPGFARGLLLAHVSLLLFLAHRRWLPGGFLSWKWLTWTGLGTLNRQAVVAAWMTCNFVGIVCLRTMHFQFLVWYFHSVPFLAWYALRPERYDGLRWLLQCVLVAALVLGVELPFLLTGHGLVRGPDGRRWETQGTPRSLGSLLLQLTHAVLLTLLLVRPRSRGEGLVHLEDEEHSSSTKSVERR